MELTFWHSPFDSRSLDVLADDLQRIASEYGGHPNLLLPTHYGRDFQSSVKQSLDPSLLVDSISKLAAIRRTVEAKGIGFGAWGVPLDVDDAHLAAVVANVSGYYVANVEPDPTNFWHPGDNADAAKSWVSTFLNTQNIGSDSLGATLVPNASHLDWSDATLQAWYDELRVHAEIYGGNATSNYYHYPNLWPWPSYAAIDNRFRWWTSNETAHIIPIMHADNLPSTGDIDLFNLLSPGNVHVWSA